MAEVTAMRNNALPYPVYGTAWTVVAPLLDADGDPVSPSSPDSEVSKNGDTFADCTNEATEIATSSGVVYLTLTSTEMTADIVTVRIQSTGAKTTVLTLYPRKLAVLTSGTCQGSNDTGDIQLASGDSAVDDIYNGCLCVAVIDGTTEARIINDYVGSTKVAEISPAWNTAQPDSNDTYTIYLPEGRSVTAANTTHISGTSQTARDIGASVLLSNGTGTGQVKLASGYVAMTWADIGSPTTTVNLSGTTVKTATDVETDTADIQSRLPAALVSGRMSSDAVAISGSTTAADNVEANIGNLDAAVSSRGTSTLTQTQVTGGAYALNSASFAFNSALDLTTTQKASVTTAATAATPSVTVSDKTGFSLSSSGLAAVTTWTVAITGNITGNLSGTIGGITAACAAQFFTLNSTKTYADAVAGSVVAEIADNAGGSGLTVQDIVDGVFDEAAGAHTGIIPTYLNASVSSRLASASYTAPDNTSITAIKAKTDSLTFTVSGQVDSNVQYVNDVQIIGAGVPTTNPWRPA